MHACRLLRPSAQEAPGRAARLAAANSGVLRAHFGELTAALLAPFAGFFQPTPPPAGEGPIPSAGPPHLPPFSHADFLDGLAAPQAAFPHILLSRFASPVLLHAHLLGVYQQFCMHAISWHY